MAVARAKFQTQDLPRDGVVEQFLTFLEENERSCEVDGHEEGDHSNRDGKSDHHRHPKFICINAVKTYLEGPRGKHEPLKELLDSIFHGAQRTPNHKTILSSTGSSYVAMLCILTKLGEGDLIYHFISVHLDDGHLPFSLKSRREHFPLHTRFPNFYERFCETQWMFCVPDFYKAIGPQKFGEDLILPITKKSRLGCAGSADVYEIQIHACYNKFHDDHDGPGKSFRKCPPTSDPPDESSNTFVLKTYSTPSAPTDYETEVNAYRTLERSEADRGNIVEFYGNFTQKQNRKDTFNIIMERADEGSLEAYFANHDPPSESKDIYNFWRNLFGILIALHNVHFAEQEVSGHQRLLKGWHQDVKPANILVSRNRETSPYKFTFKLADFGNSQFKKMTECGVESTATDSRGTSTYGAPECHNPERLKKSRHRIKQKVDIWSFGCVLSESAVWVSRGYRGGVLKYRDELFKEAFSKDPELGACFHNGTKVLDAVSRWHAAVRMTERKSDNITAGVLKIIEKEMLVPIPERRPDADCLWAMAEDLFQAQNSTDRVSNLHEFLKAHPTAPLAPLAPLAPPAPPAPPAPTIPLPPMPLTSNAARASGIAHTPPATPALEKVVPYGTSFNWEEATHDYPRTQHYLQEQHRTIEQCQANISPVKTILSLLSSAESLRETDPRTARKYVDEARKVVDTIVQKFTSENPNQKLPGYILEQHLNAWTGMTKCELAIIDHPYTTLPGEEKDRHLKKAKKYARDAFKAQKLINPGSKTCEALDLLKARGEEIR